MIHNEQDFCDWLDTQLSEDIPERIIAFNINIYESPFLVEIVGTEEFDLDNEDWLPKKRQIEVSESLFGSSWQTAEQNLLQFTKQYVNSCGSISQKALSNKSLSIGFVGGNLNIVKHT
ncbi:hypothetical protein [Vibrio diazotrophicus]|uniref:hypothetical protein n=1 Tax=Vibrio diazotrophicus TaxID=685 RepID=UPI00142DDD71|nr:hypothetical protein [Vibrio diazotrophicus]NIY94619.1 hypothetical protein [Vibrio diazotrophicus]